MVYFVIAYYVIMLMITPVFAEKKTLKETPLLMLGSMFNQAVFFTLFLSPSFHYPVFCYIPGFFILLVQMLQRHFDDDELTVKDIISGYVVGLTAAIFLWYILQKRELERFFHNFNATRNEEIAVKKQLQTEHVLNLQHNAILIASVEVSDEAENDLEV